MIKKYLDQSEIKQSEDIHFSSLVSKHLETSRNTLPLMTEWRSLGTIGTKCTCTLGELFQEQARHVLKQRTQKHLHLIVKDCFK